MIKRSFNWQWQPAPTWTKGPCLGVRNSPILCLLSINVYPSEVPSVERPLVIDTSRAHSVLLLSGHWLGKRVPWTWQGPFTVNLKAGKSLRGDLSTMFTSQAYIGLVRAIPWRQFENGETPNELQFAVFFRGNVRNSTYEIVTSDLHQNVVANYCSFKHKVDLWIVGQ